MLHSAEGRFTRTMARMRRQRSVLCCSVLCVSVEHCKRQSKIARKGKRVGMQQSICTAERTRFDPYGSRFEGFRLRCVRYLLCPAIRSHRLALKRQTTQSELLLRPGGHQYAREWMRRRDMHRCSLLALSQELLDGLQAGPTADS